MLTIVPCYFWHTREKLCMIDLGSIVGPKVTKYDHIILIQISKLKTVKLLKIKLSLKKLKFQSFVPFIIGSNNM